MGSSAQLLPPKTAMQFALRARNGEGVRTGSFVEFPQNSNVVCVMFYESDKPDGHIVKDPRRADELRRILSKSSEPGHE